MTRFTILHLVLKTANLAIAEELGLVGAIETLYRRGDPLVLQGCTGGLKRLNEVKANVEEAIYQLRRLKEDFEAEHEEGA